MRRNSNDPLISLISRSLELWVKSKCQSIERINIEINSSIGELLKGNISEVRVSASRIKLQNIPINHAELTTDSIKFKLNPISTKKKFNLKRDFFIMGEVSFSEEDLNTLINSSNWQWLNDLISDKLLAAEKINELRLSPRKIEFLNNAKSIEGLKGNEFSLEADHGTVLIKNLGGKKEEFLLPMDPLIEVTEAISSDKKLTLKGKSKVRI